MTQYDASTYDGRRKIMEDRDDLFKLIHEEVDANPDEETERESQLSESMQELMSILYESGELRRAFSEHRVRKERE